MLRTIPLAALAVLTVAATPVAAAESWGLENERLVQLSGRVVDLLCEVAGDCSEACGAGKRQLGFLASDGRLYPAAKGNVFFAGAVVDLLPYCGQEIEVDGLVIESPRMPLLFVQALKPPGATEFAPADAFQKAWTDAHGAADEWYRADPDVKAVIAADGVSGIKGLEPQP